MRKMNNAAMTKTPRKPLSRKRRLQSTSTHQTGTKLNTAVGGEVVTTSF